jgi:hypothetical protein
MANPNKDKGTRTETAVARFLNRTLAPLDISVTRAPLHGSKDEGDITGLEVNGTRFAMGCKASKELRPVEWMRRGEDIKRNAHADAYSEVYKPRGVGEATIGHCIVMMRLDDFAEMLVKLGGGRTCSLVLEGGQPSCDECGAKLVGLGPGCYCPKCGCKITSTVAYGWAD